MHMFVQKCKQPFSLLFFTLFVLGFGILLLTTGSLQRAGYYTAAISLFFLLWQLLKDTPLRHVGWRFCTPVSIALCAVLFFLSCVGHQDAQFMWDSHIYYTSASLVLEGGFYAFPPAEMYRGSHLAFLLAFFQGAFSFLSVPARWSYYICSSLLYGSLFGWLMPSLLEKWFSRRLCTLARLFPALMACLFMWGLFVLPLSDGYAAFFLFLSLLALWQLCTAKKRAIPLWQQIIWAIGLGFFLYNLYNIRSMYILVVPAAGLWLLFSLIKQFGLRRLFLFLLSVVFFFISATPQILLNQANLNTSSPFLQSTYGPSGQSLMLWQLQTGMYMQRYDTYIGPLEIYEIPNVPYYDFAGDLMHDAYGKPFESIGEYVAFVLDNPLGMAGVYGRHFINLMDNRYPGFFISDLQTSRLPEVLFNLALWWFGALAVAYAFFKRKHFSLHTKEGRATLFQVLDTRIIHLALLFLGPLCALPGAVEIRFAMPVYIFLYTGLSLLLQEADFFVWLRKNWLVAMVLGAVGAVFLNSVWTSAISGITLYPW